MNNKEKLGKPSSACPRVKVIVVSKRGRLKSGNSWANGSFVVVKRDNKDLQGEGKEDTGKELEAPSKMEIKIRQNINAKKSGAQVMGKDAGPMYKHLDKDSVIKLLETKACTVSFGPGNNEEKGYCYPILISFLRNLTDEQWQALYEALKSPMNSEDLVKLCKTIVTFISLTTLHILVPALARILGVTGCQEDNIDSTKRASSAKPFAAFQQERLQLIREVKYLAKEIHNSGSGAHIFRSRTPNSYQSSVKDDIGMSEENIITSVQKQLSNHDIMSSCPPELTVDLIKKVVEQLNSTLSVTIGRTFSGQFSQVASSSQTTEQMVNMFKRFFDDHINPEEKFDIEHCFRTATEKVINVFEDLLDEYEKEDLQSAKVFRDLVGKVKTLASGSELSEEHLGAECSSVPEVGSEGFGVTPSSIIHELSLEKFQKKATQKVKRILNKSVKSFLKSSLPTSLYQTISLMSPATSTISSKHTAAAAFEMVESISSDMKSIFSHPASSNSLCQADSTFEENCEKTDSGAEPVGSQSNVEMSEKKIWATGKAVYLNLKTKMKRYLTMERQAKATTAQAKETLSHILVSIYEELSKSDQISAAELSQIDNSIAIMLDDIYNMSSGCGQEVISQDPQRPLSSFSTSSTNSTISSKSTPSVRYFDSQWEFSLPGTPTLPDIPEVVTPPIVRCSVIDMSEPTKVETLEYDARKSMSAIANSIMKEVYPEENGKVMSQPDLAVAISRLEDLMSQERIVALSCSLAHQVNSIISDSNLSPLVLTAPAGKSTSDTALDKLKRKDTNVVKPTSYDLVQLFAEESVKRLLLPCFVPSLSSSSLAQGVSVLVTVPKDRISCSSNSSEFIETVNLFIKVLVSQVMEFVVSDAQSRASSPSERTETSVVRGFGENIDGKEDTRSCSHLAQNTVFDQRSTSPDALPLTPTSDHLDSDDDFISLIGLLVVRLLSKIQTKANLEPVDIAGKSQELIPKVMAAFCATSGYSETQTYPEKLKIQKVYRAVYRNILEEFGSEKFLQMAISTQDPKFDMILVKSLSKELFDRCNEATRASSRTSFKATGPEVLPLVEAIPLVEAVPLVEEVKADKMKCSFLQRLVRVGKPSKKKNKRDCRKGSDLSIPEDLITVEDILENHLSTSQQGKPFFIRMFSAMSKYLSRHFRCFSKRK
ncbi:uncharacterized protein LOC105026700 isoform X2 [Esox lucius]|uniref:uncharacterized protein LOC105026700 isoform X2 n=1 Tax=Esox lucius TaxID=8010 RepID=UPI001476D14B|nr:uncharacterized protein LOC105026700 isoform X2 [Esox lucius]